MPTLRRWIHDRWSTETMLVVESVSALVCIVVAAVLLKRFGETGVRHKNLAPGAE